MIQSSKGIAEKLRHFPFNQLPRLLGELNGAVLGGLGKFFLGTIQHLLPYLLDSRLKSTHRFFDARLKLSPGGFPETPYVVADFPSGCGQSRQLFFSLVLLIGQQILLALA